MSLKGAVDNNLRQSERQFRQLLTTAVTVVYVYGHPTPASKH